MKKSFLTGLALLLPLLVTILLAAFTVKIFTKPFEDFFKQLLEGWGLGRRDFFFVNSQQILRFLSQALIIISLISTTIFVGFLTRLVAIKTAINYGDRIIHKIPLVNKVYKTSQDVVHTLTKPNSASFKKVVMVPFPQKGSMSLGLLTQEEENPCQSISKEPLWTVFIPATPNPTMGYLCIYPKKSVVLLDMTVEEALKSVVSCGLILPKIKRRDV